MVKTLILPIILALFLIFPATVNGQGVNSFDPLALNLQTTKPVDMRIKVLEDYLQKHNSPLKPHAKDFIEAADTYDMDWKLVCSIAGVESTFGKRIPGGYNAWGWGVYGTQAMGFESWRDGIFTVSQGLKKNYIDKGLTEPMAMNKKYAASQTWGTKVTFFMNDIDKFSKNYRIETPVTKKTLEFQEKNDSAKLQTMEPVYLVSSK